MGIDCGSDCEEIYEVNTIVTLTATPDAGSAFVRWDGDCVTCGSNFVCNITIDSDKSCEVVFKKSAEQDGGIDIAEDISQDTNPLDVVLKDTISPEDVLVISDTIGGSDILTIDIESDVSGNIIEGETNGCSCSLLE